MSSVPTVLFANLPWFSTEDSPSDPRTHYLRRGIRAGSRWPFSVPAFAAPGSANVRLGEYVPAPYFLQSAAAWTKRACPDATVILRDSIARYESNAEFDAFWCETAPTHVIMETGSPCWPNDLKYIRAMKRSNPAVQIAVAGPPTRELAKAHASEPVDAWLLGEYDILSARFVQGERGVLGFDLVTKQEMATMPFPLFDEPVSLHYFDANPRGQTWPHLQLWASRGCVYKCCFCSWPATMTGDDPTGNNPRSVRHYSSAWIEAFIRERVSVAAKAGRPLQSIYFDDDWFNNSKRHVLEVCEVMPRIGLPWFAMCRVDSSDDETWKAMRKAGCRGVKVGFESGVQRVVDEIVNKRLDVLAGVERCKWLRDEVGLTVHTTWTCGLPGEAVEEQRMTRALIRHMYEIKAHDTHQLSGTASVEGTPMNAVENGAKLSKYPGAKVDANYVHDRDGVHKIETMNRTP